MGPLALVLLSALPCATRFGAGFTVQPLDGGALEVTRISTGGSNDLVQWSVLKVDPGDCSYRGARFESVTGSAFGSMQVMSSGGVKPESVLSDFGLVLGEAGHPADEIALGVNTARAGPALAQRASAVSSADFESDCDAPLGGGCGQAFRTVRGDRFAKVAAEARLGGLIITTWEDQAPLPQRHQMTLIEQPSRDRHLWLRETGLPVRVVDNSLWLLIRDVNGYPLVVLGVDLTSGLQSPLEVPGPRGHRCDGPQQLQEVTAKGLLVLDGESDAARARAKPRLVRWHEIKPPRCPNVIRE